jgi:hypothetical protein
VAILLELVSSRMSMVKGEKSITVYCWILIVNYGVKIKMPIL